MQSPCCFYIFLSTLLMTEAVFMKLGMYIMTHEPTYFINPFHQSVCLYVYPLVARQRLGNKVTVASNAHATVEE
jgi:hypothetical protein